MCRCLSAVGVQLVVLSLPYLAGKDWIEEIGVGLGVGGSALASLAINNCGAE